MSTTSTAMSISTADLKAMFDGLAQTVMNTTFTRTDWRRSQLSIEPTRSQIGCVDQELSQLQGFSEIYIRRNNQVLSAQIGAWTDQNRCPVTVVGLTDLNTVCTLRVTNVVHPASDLGVALYKWLECATTSGLGASLQDDFGRHLGGVRSGC
jgi:hypothetical protein